VLFQKHNIPCTYAVIPNTYREFSADPTDCVAMDPETAERLNEAVQSGLVEVALHGFTHHANSVASASPYDKSEFWGLDYSFQFRMLSEGRRTLESLYHVSVTTFIPPWNSYDENTLRALDDLGFKVVSGSRRTHKIEAHGRYQRLRFLPFTCELGQLQQALAAARKTSDPDPVIVVMFHAYDFVEQGRDRGKYSYQSLDDLLTWLVAQPDVTTQTLAGAAMLAQDLGHGRLEAFRSLEASRRLVPGFLTVKAYMPFYPSTRLALRMRIESWGRVILFYLLLTAVTAVLVGLAANITVSLTKLSALPRIAEYASARLLGLYIIGFSVVSLLHHAVRPRHIMVLAVLLGAYLGMRVVTNV
jgi:predicted deacetylase